MTHTPGPWAIEEAGNTGEAFVITADTRDICWTADSTGTEDDGTGLLVTDEDKANARLIAAAPELLAALRTAVQVMQDNNLDEALAGEFDIFTDSIAKAEGRE
jgi:hypothetical protein